MTKQSKKLYNSFDYKSPTPLKIDDLPGTTDCVPSVYNRVRDYLFREAAKKNLRAYDYSEKHYINSLLEEYYKKIAELGFEIVHSDVESTALLYDLDTDMEQAVDEKMFTAVSNFGVVEIYSYTSEDYGLHVNLKVISTLKKEVEELSKFHKENKKDTKTGGAVYTVIKTQTGFEFINLGKQGEDLIEDNYPKEFSESFKYISEQLQTQNSNGKLTILSGPPGTGKTYFVRALLKSCPDARMVIVSPDMLTEMTGPAILPSLTEFKTEHKNASLVFIMEDADGCLVPRGADNINSISSILNLSDGILGSLIDIKIVATTNAKIDEFDPAIMREGRLCKSLHFESLSPSHAARIYERVAGKPIPHRLYEQYEKKSPVLAKIYSDAKNVEYKEKEPEKKAKLGF